jgi:hypothetical protein
MMYAYIDESGQEGDDWMVVGGFFGSEEQWADFVPKWQAALGPQRKSLHVTELRWTMPYNRLLLERLGPVPTGCGLRRMIGAVRFADYADLVPDNVKMKGYTTALRPLIVQILKAVPSTDRIEFVFEQQNEYAGAVSELMEFFSRPGHPYRETADGLPKIAGVSFEPKSSAPMMHAADYLAFAMRCWCLDRTSLKSQWTQSILLSDGAEAWGHVYSRDEIRTMVMRTNDAYAAGVLSRGRVRGLSSLRMEHDEDQP